MDEEAQTDQAQNSQENSVPRNPAEHLAEYKWQPGQSGNPGGRPKRKPLTDLYEEMLNDPELIQVIHGAVKKAVSKGQMAMVLQLKEMAERVEGKVTQPIDAELTISTLSERMRRAKERLQE